MYQIYRISIVIALFLGACAQNSLTYQKGSAHRVTRDYIAIGDSAGIQPYIHEGRTFIKVIKEKDPIRNIVDAENTTLEFTKEKDTYVLDQIADVMLVSVNGKAVRFELVALSTFNHSEHESMLSEDTMHRISAIEDDSIVQFVDENTEINTSQPSIFSVMKHQLAQQRTLLNKEQEKRQHLSSELSDIADRLDYIESKMAIDTAVVHAYFPVMGTKFKPEQYMETALLSVVTTAKKINLYGRTDSTIENNLNRRLAFERALSAKKYLIQKGVPINKIEISSLGSGDFIAPSSSSLGRALNRRVTIEIIN